MAVAVKNATETASQGLYQRHRLALNSLAGAAYLLGSIALVFYALPELWWKVLFTSAGASESFVLVAFQVVVMAGAAVGLGFLGSRLVGGKPDQTLRAGIFLGCAGIFGLAYATWLVGKFLEATFFRDPNLWPGGIATMLVVGAGLLYLLGRFCLGPRFEELAGAIGEQGWFNATSYKRTQGQRVRRGTMVGIMVLAGCGIYTLLTHHTLESTGKDWVWSVPMSQERVTLLGDVRFTVPLILGGLSLWLAFRAVNLPVFADFQIATEAEINKVSWSTRRRLVQDTIVVLTTVILLTVFLFFVDILWGYLLTKVGVLRADPNQGQTTTEDVQQW